MHGVIECGICSARASFRYRWRNYDVYCCPDCGTEQVSPTPGSAELDAFYQGFNASYMERWQRRLELVRPAVAYYLARYSEVVGKPRPQAMLDLGGGVGYYTRAATDCGVKACLLDYGGDAIEFARSTLGLEWTLTGDIHSCPRLLPGSVFDFVLARHSIEHLPDPAGFLAAVASVMPEGGVLQIETPDVSSREQWAHPAIAGENFRILRRDNPGMGSARALRAAMAKSMSGVNPPKHLWGFTPKSLSLLLGRSGFAVQEVRREPAGHPLFDPLYWDFHRREDRRGLAVPYYYFERAAGRLFSGRGMNLAILALRRTQVAPGPRAQDRLTAAKPATARTT